ncbi:MULTISPECIES: hypothetical protein [unclassified Sutcliffiella]|uniref:hypothetical protein n=1 Tax=unclassified Sutcliffiella TaxID=2837532 RepID=UPI0030D622D3
MPSFFGESTTYESYTGHLLLGIFLSYSVIFTYGILASITSDKIGELISIKAEEKKAEIIVSGALHMVFGVILFWFSLVPAAMMFIIDWILKMKREKYESKFAFLSMSIPLTFGISARLFLT